MVAMTQEFRVTAQWRRSGWWVLEAPEVGAISQVRALGEADDEMREAVAYLADVPESEVVVRIEPELPEAYREHRAASDRESREAAEARTRAAEESRAAARVLRAQRLTLRDIGTVMGVSTQRAHQLVRA